MTARRVTWWLLIVVLTVATVAATVVGAGQLVAKSRPPAAPVADQAAARQRAIEAASTATVRILSYYPDTIDQDVRATKALLTGEFLQHYDQFSRDIVIPGARAQRISTSATVPQAGLESLDGDTATVLVFVDQATTGNDRPEPTVSASAVRVGLKKVRDKWLIERFDPV